MNKCAPSPTLRIGRVGLLICMSSVIVAGCVPNTPSGNNPLPGNDQPGDNPPVASAGADQAVNAGASVTLDGSASSDPDGDAISFSWKQTLGTSVSLNSTSAAIVAFTAPTNGTLLTFELTVSDGKNDSVGTVSVSVRPVEQSVQLDEMLQRSVTEDPAVMGDFPNGWLVADAGADLPVRPPDEVAEFSEIFQNVQAPPVVEEDLSPGATRTVSLQVPRPSGLVGSARWVGTISPLDVTIALDGSTLATGTAYHFGTNRGGSFLQTEAAVGGLATMSVTNTSDVTVKVRIVFMGAR